jgi:hypothetical protein
MAAHASFQPTWWQRLSWGALWQRPTLLEFVRRVLLRSLSSPGLPCLLWLSPALPLDAVLSAESPDAGDGAASAMDPAAGHLLEKIVVAGFDSYDALAGA